MADTNINDNGGGSATTVLVTVIIIGIIAAAFYFGYARSHWGSAPADDSSSVNIDINGTFPAGSGEEGGAAE